MGVGSGSALEGLVNLETLNLSANNIRKIGDHDLVSLAHSPLRTLDLSENRISTLSPFAFAKLYSLKVGTMVENSQEYRLKYWATRSFVRSFARTAHSFACSGLLASLAHFAHSLARGKVNDWMAILSVFFYIFDHSDRVIRNMLPIGLEQLS